jgi:hypothetical protein
MITAEHLYIRGFPDMRHDYSWASIYPWISRHASWLQLNIYTSVDFQTCVMITAEHLYIRGFPDMRHDYSWASIHPWISRYASWLQLNIYTSVDFQTCVMITAEHLYIRVLTLTIVNVSMSEALYARCNGMRFLGCLKLEYSNIKVVLRYHK